MRSWPDPKSPWKKQVRFEEKEFEAMMDELRERSGQLMHAPGTGIDVDSVMLRGLGVEADYLDLPTGMMGRTRFMANGSVVVEVTRELSELALRDTTARRRLRSTLAHECGHIACHRGLHLRDDETLALFPADGASSVERVSIMCRQEVADVPGYRGEWWEHQANRCMAELLLPRRGFSEVVRRSIAESGFESFDQVLRGGRGEALARRLSDEFDVSLQMTLFRLQALGFVPQEMQRNLRLRA